ncbi:fasciclin domain-containing protein [Paraflavisolibacter sp. H34]|uniref:fasciclin domain-containing protein n=1 Tax=Huijunlia imazamoxiresistens TaxID=3127457 RepID=UPI00301A4E05
MTKLSKWCAVLAASCLTVFWACKKTEIQEFTTTDTNIVGYLRAHPDQFSDFQRVLDRTGISPYLNAYGAYTLFAPTNEAVQSYLAEKGIKSMEELDSAQLINLVKLHLIRDTLPTTRFTDGKMGMPTMQGQYLLTRANNTGQTELNRRARITQSNILTGNGYIHVIDKVLLPAQKTLAQLIEENPDYTILTEALKATGLYNSLNSTNNPDTTKRWLTVLAVSDAVLRSQNIHSYADIQRRFHGTDTAGPKQDSAYMYVAYHILNDMKYVADVASAPSHNTLAYQNVVTTIVDSAQRLLLNDAVFNNVHEEGVVLHRATSDNVATNGVLHTLQGDISIKKRDPFAVFFDVADQPEIRKNVGVFRKASKSVSFNPGQLRDVAWQQGTITYQVEGANSSNYHYWDDFLRFGLRTSSAVNNWIEFTTPLLVAGQYKVWICYRRDAHGAYTQVSFDGNPLSRIVNLNAYIFSSTASDPVQEAQGFKRYSFGLVTGINADGTYKISQPNSATAQPAQLAGIINVKTTDRHKIKLQAIKDFGSGGAGVNLDMIQFIPVDQDQQYPRFGRDGSQIDHK